MYKKTFYLFGRQPRLLYYMNTTYPYVLYNTNMYQFHIKVNLKIHLYTSLT